MISAPKVLQPRLILAAVCSLIALLVGWDLASDRRAGVDFSHMIVESLVLMLALGSALSLISRFWWQNRQLKFLSNDLQKAHVESAQWRSRYHETISGLSKAIRLQFSEWRLSGAESDVALLILKGLGLKEIAVLRDTSERTVREQARSVYRKAGVANRASFSAFFLEDLLPPASASPEQAPK